MKMQGYLIVETGYEGIEEIVGLYDQQTAINKMRELRAKKFEYVRYGEYKHKRDTDLYCVMRVDEHGSKCVCRELKVSPSKQMLR